jgi:hypothetical protein
LRELLVAGAPAADVPVFSDSMLMLISPDKNRTLFGGNVAAKG